MIQKIKYSLLLFCSCCAILACKKNESLPTLPNSKITAFKVPLAEGDIYAAIDQQEHLITLYLPYYNELEMIVPQISLEPGATLLEQIKPISVLDTSIRYTVRGADKSISTYTLKSIVQQPGTALALQELSSANHNQVFGVGAYNLQLQGVFNTTDIEKIQAFLVDQAGHELPLLSSTEFSTAYIRVKYNSSTKQKEYSFGDLRMPTTAMPGLYQVRIKVRGATTQTQYPIKLEYQRPDVAFRSQTVTIGDTFTIKSNGNIFRNFTEFSLSVGGKKISCPIEQYTATEAIIRIPTTVPAGRYNPTVKFEGYPEQTLFWSLTLR